MSTAKYVLFALYAFSAVYSVARIGKTPKPTTPGSAAFSLVITAVLVWLVVIA